MFDDIGRMFEGVNWQFGTIGEWFAGIGGFLAVGVAFYFGRREHKRGVDEQAKREQAEQAVLESERIRAASQIEIRPPGSPRLPSGPPSLGTLVVSRSPWPFKDVVVRQTINGEVQAEDLGRVAPGEVRAADRLGHPRDDGTLRLEYTDQEGIRWTQNEAGEIKRLSQPTS